MKKYAAVISYLKYAGLTMAGIASLWSAANIESKEIEGKKQITTAGRISIFLTIAGLGISITSNILEDKLKSEKEKQAVIDELRKTNEIILAGQPLAQLLLEWQFENVNKTLTERIIAQESQILEDYQLGFYNVPMRSDDYKLLNGFYLLYPFLKNITNDSPEESKGKNVFTLIALDSSQNSVLPIGNFNDDIEGNNNNPEELKKRGLKYSGGIRFNGDLDHFWGQSYGMPALNLTRPINDAPILTTTGNRVIIKWQLDPYTLSNVIDKQYDNTLTANFPPLIKVLLFNGAEKLPFVENNLAIPYQCYPWEMPENPPEEKPEMTSGSTLILTPNGLRDQAAVYKQVNFLTPYLDDFWGDQIQAGFRMLLFKKV